MKIVHRVEKGNIARLDGEGQDAGEKCPLRHSMYAALQNSTRGSV
jgi:hypothetical protein